MSSRRTAVLAATAVVGGTALLLVSLRLVLPDRARSPLAEQGRAIFWGRGRCATCHPVSGEGGGIRCPDLGTAGEMKGTLRQRAEHRVPGLSAAEYLAQSLYDPGAYVVAGFPASLMPVANEAPIALTDGEIRAVLAYLAAGRRAPADAELEAAIRKARRGIHGRVEPVASGDANAGRAAYERLKCAACHVIEGVTDPAGSDAARGRGPDLTGIALVQGARYLSESIVRPDAVVVAGASGEWFSDDGRTSRMPIYPKMTETEREDLVAFLLTLR